jgi:hypothetical protein
VRQIVTGQADATASLRQAVEVHRELATVHIALACALALDGDARQSSAHTQEARQHLAGAARRDRQHVEILAAVLEDRLTQALGLAFEHLAEFGPDPLLVSMLTRRIQQRQDSGL